MPNLHFLVRCFILVMKGDIFLSILYFVYIPVLEGELGVGPGEEIDVDDGERVLVEGEERQDGKNDR